MIEKLENLLTGISITLYNFRQEAGLTQRQIAERANTRQSRISEIENDRLDDMKLSTLVRWAEAYGYDVEITFRLAEDESALQDLGEQNGSRRD